VLFYEISGAISHVESFDFKENPGTPKDLDLRRMAADLVMSHRLFPRLVKHMDELAILRSMRTHEEVHFRAQYYLQTGRQMNLAFAREIPAIGSVMAMELRWRSSASRRRVSRSAWPSVRVVWTCRSQSMSSERRLR
jgi:hypothetical protein